MKLRFLVATSVFVGLATLLSAGCGDDDPTSECEAELATYRGTPKEACIGDAEMQACIACHEECGNACATIDTACPFEYTCPTR